MPVLALGFTAHLLVGALILGGWVPGAAPERHPFEALNSNARHGA
jgi:hypothetical protein